MKKILILIFGLSIISLAGAYSFNTEEQTLIDLINTKLQEVLPQKTDSQINGFLNLMILVQKNLNTNDDKYERNYALTNEIKQSLRTYQHKDNLIGDYCINIEPDRYLREDYDITEAKKEVAKNEFGYEDESKYCFTAEEQENFQTNCRADGGQREEHYQYIHPTDEAMIKFVCTTNLPDAGSFCSNNSECLGNCIFDKEIYSQRCTANTATLRDIMNFGDLGGNMTGEARIQDFIQNSYSAFGTVYYNCSQPKVGTCSNTQTEYTKHIDHCGDLDGSIGSYEINRIRQEDGQLIEEYGDCYTVS